METIAILQKHNCHAVLSLYTYDDYDVIGQYDTRKMMIMRKKFTNPTEADQKFKEAVKISQERGWKLLYYGEKLQG